ncbi:MAG: 50S ribosomal protein L10 [Planctomycetes bacterium]|nr:50S ribosomal protein L10 [Planctomycetota bacterium]
MSKYVKGLLEKQLERKFTDITDFVVLDFKGIGGNDNNEMRGVLKEKGIGITLVRNAMMRRALDTLDRADASTFFLEGPNAVAFGGDSVVDVAKEMADWVKKFPDVEFKGAFVDGAVVDAAGAKSLAKMMSRSELQGDVVLIAQSPGSNLAGAIAGPAGAIAGCIKSLVEKLEEAA